MKNDLFNKTLDFQIEQRITDGSILGYYEVVYNSGNATTVLPHNLVVVSPQWLSQNGFEENEVVLCRCDRTKRVFECRVVSGKVLSEDGCGLSAVIREELGAEEEDTLTVAKVRSIAINNAITQKTSSVYSEKISLSENDYAYIDRKYAQHQIIHKASGASYIINTDKIDCAGDIPDGTVRMSMYQRKMLCQQTPIMLKKRTLKDIVGSKALNTEEKEKLTELYKDERINKGFDFIEGNAIKNILQKTDYFKMIIVPVFESLNVKCGSNRKNNGLFFRTMVGYTDIVLKTARPYSTDESRRIVRMSRENLNLLGIDDMDKVVIRYKNRSASVRVLNMDSMDEVRTNNIIGDDSDVNMIIGIPVFIRKELGIRDLNVTVKVERNTKFLYRKNLNIQFLPILAWLFTLVQTFQNSLETWKDYLLLVAIFVALLPFILYMVFSELRNKTQ